MFTNSLLVLSLAVLSLVGHANGYEYGGDEFITANIAVRCIYSVSCLGLVGLCTLPFAIARGHRTPYISLFISLVFMVIALLASIALAFIQWSIDGFDDTPYKVDVALDGVVSLFRLWYFVFAFLAFAHLIKVRAENIAGALENRSVGLSFVWTIAYSAMFAILLIFGTAGPAVWINFHSSLGELSDKEEIIRKIKTINGLSYTFNAIWYCSAILIGFLAYSAYEASRRAGVNDKILKVLLFVALPLHVLNVIQDIIFTILFSPSGLRITDNAAIEHASLALTIVSFGLDIATTAVLVFLGTRRSNWMIRNAANGWPKGQHAGNSPNYTLQASYQPDTSSNQMTRSKHEEMYLHL